jgi:hypothetical protein
MTAISAPAARTGATPLESMLLRASSARDAAQARGAIGVLPR